MSTLLYRKNGPTLDVVSVRTAAMILLRMIGLEWNVIHIESYEHWLQSVCNCVTAGWTDNVARQ
jgi:hypothetical protein